MTASTDGPTVLPDERRVTVRVPAKINLDLRVGPLRPDGYHDLATVFHAVDLYDEVTVTPAPAWAVHVTGPYTRFVPADGDNLALKAARLLAAAHGVSTPVAIHIDKLIPVAGGMAGGSADAAATLLACDALWSLGLGTAGLHEYAARLGSDVNFGLVGGSAVGTGRGEQVVPALSRGSFSWVIALSDAGLSTPSVFRELDRMRTGRVVPAPEPTPTILSALRSGDVDALGAAMSNDLQEAACSLRPELRDVLDAGMMLGAIAGVVSGSGPTIVFLGGDPTSAADLSVALVNSGAVARVHTATGPAPGAGIVGS